MDNSIIPTPRTHNIDLKFWLMWVVTSTAAILISAGVLYGLIFIAKAISPSINEDRLAGGIMIPIGATILGVGQWLVLRSRIPKSGWWIPATIVGVVGGIYLATGAVQVISHIIGQEWNWDFHPILLMLYVLLLYMLLGFLIALPELPILWHYHRGPILWLLVNMIGWFILGLVVGFSIDRPSDIFAVGAIPAIFTGFGLIWLMRTPRTEPDRSP